MGRIHRIVIDAGHGGDDPGAVGWTPHTPTISPRHEDDHNLTIVKEVAAELKRRGYFVVMTRSEDLTMSLRERVAMVNALSPPADAVVSIHRDAAASAKHRGMHVAYHAFGPDRPSPSSMRLAGCLQKNVICRTGLEDDGIRPRPAWNDKGEQVESSLAILRDTQPPAALLELGFMSHPGEELLGDNPEFVQAVAIGVGDGLDEYFRRAM